MRGNGDTGFSTTDRTTTFDYEQYWTSTSTRVTAGVTDCFYGLKLNIVKNVAMTGGGVTKTQTELITGLF